MTIGRLLPHHPSALLSANTFPPCPLTRRLICDYTLAALSSLLAHPAGKIPSSDPHNGLHPPAAPAYAASLIFLPIVRESRRQRTTRNVREPGLESALRDTTLPLHCPDPQCEESRDCWRPA